MRSTRGRNSIAREYIMLDALQQHFQELRQAPPGQRFLQQYERRQREHPSAALKALALAGGWLIVLLGLVMLPAPGPGMLVVVAGLATLASVSKTAAQGLDAAELMLRRGWERLRR